MGDSGAIGKMLFMTGGLLVWAVHFTIIYGFTTVACAKDFAITSILGLGIVPLALAAATLVALATTGAVLLAAISGPIPPRSARYGDSTEHFLQYTAATIAALSLVAIAWNAVPLLIVAPCSSNMSRASASTIGVHFVSLVIWPQAPLTPSNSTGSLALNEFWHHWNIDFWLLGVLLLPFRPRLRKPVRTIPACGFLSPMSWLATGTQAASFDIFVRCGVLHPCPREGGALSSSSNEKCSLCFRATRNKKSPTSEGAGRDGRMYQSPLRRDQISV